MAATSETLDCKLQHYKPKKHINSQKYTSII